MKFDHLKNAFYFNYYRIGHGSYREKVKYFEDHKEEVFALDDVQQNEIKIDYLLCLFEIGRYDHFLDKVDTMIESVIIDNIYQYNGVDIYKDLLFKKGACLYNTDKLEKAGIVLKALLKLDAENEGARALFTRCRRRHVSTKYQSIKAVAMVLLLSTLSIAFMELFIVKPFYDEYINTFSSLKITFLVLAVIILACSELYFKYNLGKEIGYKLDIKGKLSRINKWFLDQSSGKGNLPF